MVCLRYKKLGDTKVSISKITGLAAPEGRELSTRFLFMRQPIVNKVVTSIFVVALSFLVFENAWAAFTLSATPFEGGFDIRFGKLRAEVPEVKKEITLRVTTDQGKKYRVYQELVTPLRNSEGQEIPYNNLQFYTLQGSNSLGSLTTTQEQGVRRGRSLLYTSNTQGQGDSFILVHTLSLPEGLPSGTYRGRFQFTVETTDGSQVQRININAVVTLESSASVEVSTSSGSRTIELKAGDLLAQKNEVLFEVTGSLGRTYRITQSLVDSLRSDGEELPQGSVIFKVSEGRNGAVAGEGSLSRRDETLYTSSPHGDADTILVSYKLTEPLNASAGTYRGRIQFFIEGAASLKTTSSFSFNFVVKIDPTFELNVSPETGGRIEFRDLKPQEQAKINEVIVEVNTNLGKPYQISQKVERLLTNKDGTTISKERFVFRQEKITDGGILKQPSNTPVEIGETTIYISDGKGSPANFKIIYELTVPEDLRAGNYSSNITYSISEL